ncbi:MAG: prolipoprotein diacylglyceryl transferase [Bacteroidia bacterium]|nr:prolipoprotein diacylglyceryl transferase [Bacteroidia bacterium]
MEKYVLMDISNSGLLYQIFYLAAFLAAYIIIIYEGYRRKFPLLNWILILAGIRLAVIIGTKIFAYSAEEWRYMFENHIFLPNHQKTMFGGFLLGVAAYIFSRYILKFKHSAWDTVAIAFPAAVSIQTLGCFFYGCCFGTSTSLPWAVQYPVMSLAHYNQFESGILTHNDLYSLPVHPVQLYQCLAGLLVILLVLRFRRYWKANGSILLSSMIFFALARFITEFFRDPLSNKTGGEMLWILKQVQWQYLIFAFLMTLLLFWREKTYRIKPQIINQKSIGLKLQISFLFSLILILLFLRSWFTLPEIIALNIALLPAIFLIGTEVYRTFNSLKYKWIYAFTILLPVFLMSQTIPQTQIDTAGTKKYNIYHTFGGGFATGNYTDERTTHTGEGCSTVTNHQYFTQKYTAGGAGYSITKETPDRKKMMKYGINVFLGDFEQVRQRDQQRVNEFIFGVNPFIKYDYKWIGVGAGLHLGNLPYSTGDTDKETSTIPQSGYFQTFIFPQFYFRVGVQRYFFGDFHIADQFPVSSPGLAFQAGIGTGLGLKSGLNLRAGLSFIEDGGFYFSAYLPIKNRLVLEPAFLWTIKLEKDRYPVNLPENQFSLGLSYRFGYK